MKNEGPMELVRNLGFLLAEYISHTDNKTVSEKQKKEINRIIMLHLDEIYDVTEAVLQINEELRK